MFMLWLAERIGVRKKTSTTKAIALNDEETIRLYGAVLERLTDATLGIIDETQLPLPKLQIKQALLRNLPKISPGNMRNHFEQALLALASFQKGVGKKPLYPHGLSPELIR